MNRMPRCALLISPGRTRPVPPPSTALLVAVWCGAENGGRRTSPSTVTGPGEPPAPPASDSSAVSSSASSTSRSGMSPGMRSASDVLPAPFGPDSRRWWPPAAATSSAKRASATPTRSLRSRTPRRAGSADASSGDDRTTRTGDAVGISRPVSTATAWARERTPVTAMPGTSAASAACGSGTITCVSPCVRAASTIGRMPGTGRRAPSRASSPMSAVSRSPDRSTLSSEASSTAQAMARSRWLPRFGRSAGLRRMVVRLVVGQAKPELSTAVRHRSRASLMDASGRPTTSVTTWPMDTSTCTST